jgi:hypothetical protein
MSVTIHRHSSDITNFGSYLTTIFSDEELLKFFSDYIVHHFKVKGKWSGKEVTANGITFSSDRIDVRYTTHNSYRVYARHFMDHHIQLIKDFMESYEKLNDIQKNHKKMTIHNPTEYNSMRMMMNKNMVVIQYIKEGYSPLLSMTVGKYYIAEKVVNNGVPSYALWTHNELDRKSDDFIRVNQKIDNITRFTEYTIDSWTEENNFMRCSVNLCPVIKSPVNDMLHYINPKTGMFNRVGTTTFMVSINAKIEQFIHNLQPYASYAVLRENTFGTTGSGSVATRNDVEMGTIMAPPANGVALRYDNSYSNLTVRNDGSTTLHVRGMSFDDDDDTVDAAELKLLRQCTQVVQHKVDEKLGLNTDYLLLK